MVTAAAEANGAPVEEFAVETSSDPGFADSSSVTDQPDPEIDFSSKEGSERLRRGMLALHADTLFGPFVFDENQRNTGRAPAGMQWLPFRPEQTRGRFGTATEYLRPAERLRHDHTSASCI